MFWQGELCNPLLDDSSQSSQVHRFDDSNVSVVCHPGCGVLPRHAVYLYILTDVVTSTFISAGDM